MSSAAVAPSSSSAEEEAPAESAPSSAVDDAVRADLASPASSPEGGDEGEADDGGGRGRRAHSFRARRLTYSRHHVLSDPAAAAVAELLAEGGSFSDEREDEQEEAEAEGGGGRGGTAGEGARVEAADEEEAADEGPRPRKRPRAGSGTSAGSGVSGGRDSPAKKRGGKGGKRGGGARLPSRVLHAGEIVRRHSSSGDKHDVRTGKHSHPTHPDVWKNGHRRHSHSSHGSQSTEGAGGGRSWRRRFSFGSHEPDEILPFPRDVVGTYSCHGCEPVYDSDYEEEEEEEEEEKNANEEGRQGSQLSLPKTATAKINQDRGGITYPYANSDRQALFAVYDGHGEGGELVSQYALGEVGRLLEEKLGGLGAPSKRKSEGKKLDSIAEDREEHEGCARDDGGSDQEASKRERKLDEEEAFISKAMKETLLEVDRGLRFADEIEVSLHAGPRDRRPPTLKKSGPAWLNLCLCGSRKAKDGRQRTKGKNAARQLRSIVKNALICPKRRLKGAVPCQRAFATTGRLHPSGYYLSGVLLLVAFAAWAVSFSEVTIIVDFQSPRIQTEPMYSGTTACVVLLRGDRLYVCNCGDSRAVLARSEPRREAGGDAGEAADDEGSDDPARPAPPAPSSSLSAVPLSEDHNPDSPEEEARIVAAGGYVSPPPAPGLSARVWLDPAQTQVGLAMSRSLGDHAARGAGVIADPDVTAHDLAEGDEFIVMATDGVWEFIKSEDAVEIVGKRLKKEGDDEDGGGGASAACEALIRASSDRWHEHEGDYRDDITAIVIRLKDLWR
ncbi:hypothetical protein ACHAWF_015844 [Thalassiosira exigua]